MSNLVLKRKTGESIFIYIGGHEVQITIRLANSGGVKICYSSSCEIGIVTQNQTITIGPDDQTIISHSNGNIEISGLLDDQNRPVRVKCSFKFEKMGQVKIAFDAPYCVEILRDELISTEVIS